MSNIIDKKKVTLDEALDSKSLKKMKTPELERILQTLLCDMSDNDATVNTIIAELLKRGVSKEDMTKEAGDNDKKEKLKKAFESLEIDKVSKKVKENRTVAKEEENYSTEQLELFLKQRIADYKKQGLSDAEIEETKEIKGLRLQIAESIVAADVSKIK